MSHSFDDLDEDDVLTKSAFHSILVALYAPASWPRGLLALVAASLALLTGLLWWLGSADTALGGSVAAILLAFFVSDAAILRMLPRRRISFGPWRGQFLALALPRTAVSLLAILPGPLLGWTTALLLVVVAQFAGTAALLRGAMVEPRRLGLTRLHVKSDRLPPGTPPIRILHIGDLHLERPGQREDRLLELVREAKPDLILLTGDYVNTSFNQDANTLAAVRDLLGQLSAPLGVYAVRGSPPVDRPATLVALFEDLPIRLLRNDVAEVTGDEGRRLALLGLDCHHDIPRDRRALARLLGSPLGNGPRILLYHSPELMPDAVAAGIDLYLCGHTHGGQVRLPVIGPLLTMSKLGRRYVMGHYNEGRTHLYVTRGIGFEGLSAPRVRLLCPPEVTLVELGAGKQ